MSSPVHACPANLLALWRHQCPLPSALRDPSTRGEGVRVALIDTEVQWDMLRLRHPQPAEKHPSTSRVNPPAKSPTHGTLMADILLHQAPGIHLQSHDVFLGRPTAEPEAMVSALAAIRREGTCKVINLSLGIPEDRWDAPKWRTARQLLTREVLGCYRAGMVVVASAHNAHPILQSCPADNPAPLISVAKAAFDDGLRLEYRPGDTAEFRARETGYWGIAGSVSSSSSAAAHAAGLVCRLLGLERNLGPFEVKALLAWYAAGYGNA